jgi:hypothetical protein
MATTGADNPAVEFPIYIENALCTREYSHRALAADGLHRIPVDPVEVWNQISLVPPDPLDPPLGLVVNMGPGTGVVELVAMVLAPVAGSKLKWEFVSWAGTGPPAAPNVSHPLSRVIPATFGSKGGLLGAYRPTLTGAPAHDGHSWVVDGLNHYVEFPYGPPPSLPAAPVLTFYRYTGTTGGNGSETGPPGEIGPKGPTGEIGFKGPTGDTGPLGPDGDTGPAGTAGAAGAAGAAGPAGPEGAAGGSSTLALNWANIPGSFTDTFTLTADDGVVRKAIGFGPVSGYYPTNRCIPLALLQLLDSTFEFEVTGIFDLVIYTGAQPVITLGFGILVDNVNTTVPNFSSLLPATSQVLGLTNCVVPPDFAVGSQENYWRYKLTATHTPPGDPSPTQLNMTWSAEVMLIKRFGGTGLQRYAVGTSTFTLPNGTNDVEFSVFMSASSNSYTPTSIAVTKYQHIFKHVAVTPA